MPLRRADTYTAAMKATPSTSVSRMKPARSAGVPRAVIIPASLALLVSYVQPERHRDRHGLLCAHNRASQLHTVEVDRTEVAPAQVASIELRALKPRLREIDAAQRCALQPRLGEIGLAHAEV